ncbi:heparinase II/III family protein [Roseovarius sp. LXJ103]|uniref:heparinase II/III family protein n=1 Tax=Roseovarius carneus TaxID=2853164 RepID=UPI000D610E53|nr:heparinase II/III family protein [Roseovarius carneus]MBZ8117862.1 heparinase II/III family protein [Roseovarius carneus]PWE36378.1 heparinase [Pelagicola sp. LXJ1103]
MADQGTLATQWSQYLNRLHARRAARARPATAFVSSPEPRTIGSYARGRQLSAGNYMFAGSLVQTPGTSLWQITPPDAMFEAELHGFAWLDDLAASGDAKARDCAQDWLWEWIALYGGGRGPGWTPDLTGRRLIRWINHALFMLSGMPGDASETFLRSLGSQTLFAAKRWQAAAPGLPRFEAVTGVIYAGLALKGMDAHIAPALRGLEQACDEQIGTAGMLPTRNPEDLLEVFTLLTWTAEALIEADVEPGPAHRAAIERIAPTLRTLRHADGGLARFHGGGRGLEGRLDTALAASGIKTAQPDGLSMGYVRLSAGRSSLIIDAAAPPAGAASTGAHASTLAFELTSGRRPLIVNCGSGATFGVEWRRAGRATPSHSTLVLEGESSAHLGPDGPQSEWLVNGPKSVPIQLSQASDGLRFEGGHDGYAARFGLVHARTIEMTFDGRGIAGEDMLLSMEQAHRRRFDAALDATQLKGLKFAVHFHLHPDADAELDMNGAAVSIALRSGEIWVFRTDGRAQIKLEPSVYLEKSRLKPRASQQIILTGRAMEYATRVRWSLAKAQDTPIAIRDLAQDGPNDQDT